MVVSLNNDLQMFKQDYVIKCSSKNFCLRLNLMYTLPKKEKLESDITSVDNEAVTWP